MIGSAYLSIEDRRLRDATQKAKTDYADIQADHDTLKQGVMQYTCYLNAEEHVINQGMESRTAWRRQATDNLKKFAHLTALVNIYHISCTEVDMKKLEVSLNKSKPR